MRGVNRDSDELDTSDQDSEVISTMTTPQVIASHNIDRKEQSINVNSPPPKRAHKPKGTMIGTYLKIQKQEDNIEVNDSITMNIIGKKGRLSLGAKRKSNTVRDISI